MSDKNVLRHQGRARRHQRVRRKVSGTAERPRLCVYRSLKNIYVQVIDDLKGVTVAAASTLEGEGKGKAKSKTKGSDREAAARVGKLIAERAIEKGVKDVVLDRGAYIYHGRIKALADAAREAGLNF